MNVGTLSRWCRDERSLPVWIMINNGSENGVEQGWEAGFRDLCRGAWPQVSASSNFPFSLKLASSSGATPMVILNGYEVSTES